MRLRRVSNAQAANAATRLAELRAEKPPFATLQKRVEALVAAGHSGSVNAASKATGVPLGTMQRIHSGAATNPRAATLQQIAAHYNASFEWLMTGVGQVPDVLDESKRLGAIALDWYDVVDELRLPSA